jgi:hypothetical protein
MTASRLVETGRRNEVMCKLSQADVLKGILTRPPDDQVNPVIGRAAENREATIEERWVDGR